MKLIRVFGLSFIIAISALAYTETKAEVVKVNTSNKYSLTEEETNLLRKTDLNLDMIIDMEDLAIASEAYNTRDKLANVNDEPIVDIYDLTLISKNMDKAYEESGYIQSAGSVNFRKGPGEKKLYSIP